MPVLLLAAHGDRGDKERNRWLLAHAEALADGAAWGPVLAGVLKGEPVLEEALAGAFAAGAGRVLVYPLFMSDGYFMRILRQRLAAAAPPGAELTLLAPLGADPRLPGLMLAEALEAARRAGFAPAATRLLVIGHGSKVGPANAKATERVRASLEDVAPFARVDAAFLEEPPFLRPALATNRGPTVVAGFFCGEGLHAEDDVPAAIAASGARAVYTGAVGTGPAVRSLIMAAAEAALTAA